MALPVQFSPGTPPTAAAVDTWPEALNAMQQGALDVRLDFGTSGSPYTGPSFTLDWSQGGIIVRSLYVVLYMGANMTLSFANMPAGELSSAFVEVHQVGGPWTMPLKVSSGPGGATLSGFANAWDMLAIWSPDGTALRAEVDGPWS